MKLGIYPGLSQLKEICRLIFTTRVVHVRTNCSSSESFIRIEERVGRKEAIQPFLPPVVITEAGKGIFKASIRSDQIFGFSVRLQNSPEVQGVLNVVAEGAEIVAKLKYTSTFRLRLLALVLVVLAVITMALILLVNVILGRYEVTIIGLGGILMSLLMYRSIWSLVEDCREVETALLAWLHGVFPEAEASK